MGGDTRTFMAYRKGNDRHLAAIHAAAMDFQPFLPPKVTTVGDVATMSSTMGTKYTVDSFKITTKPLYLNNRA